MPTAITADAMERVQRMNEIAPALKVIDEVPDTMEASITWRATWFNLVLLLWQQPGKRVQISLLQVKAEPKTPFSDLLKS